MQVTQAIQGVQPFTSPMGSTYPSPPPAALGGQYEFGEAENRIIGSCGTRATVWGVLCGLGAALYGLAAALEILGGALRGDGMLVFRGVTYVIASAVNLTLAISFFASGRSLSSVVKTQGNDVGLMMNALKSLGRAFLVQIILFSIGLALVLAAVAFAILNLAMHHG